MTSIQCKDLFLPQDQLTSFGNDLKLIHGRLQMPLNCANPTTSNNSKITYILVLDPVVEFDEAKVDKAKIEAIMNKYGFRERS